MTELELPADWLFAVTVLSAVTVLETCRGAGTTLNAALGNGEPVRDEAVGTGISSGAGQVFNAGTMPGFNIGISKLNNSLPRMGLKARCGVGESDRWLNKGELGTEATVTGSDEWARTTAVGGICM